MTESIVRGHCNILQIIIVDCFNSTSYVEDRWIPTYLKYIQQATIVCLKGRSLLLASAKAINLAHSPALPESWRTCSKLVSEQAVG
jgi:hypothetical protein